VRPYDAPERPAFHATAQHVTVGNDPLRRSAAKRCAFVRRRSGTIRRLSFTASPNILTPPLRAGASAPAPVPTPARSRFDADGWLAGVRRIPSPNCDRRPEGASITLAVVHGISLPPGEFGGDGITRLFTNALDPAEHPYFATIAHFRVSAHFLLRRDAELVQYVPCSLRAWHAGLSSWRGREHCNDFSVGIELEGTDERPYTSRQYARLARLLTWLAARYGIAEAVGHRDVAPGRKTDPGPSFDWKRLQTMTPRLRCGPRRR
jgi:AmpD protein